MNNSKCEVNMNRSSDDSDDENEIRYGTPLEPFEDDETPAKRRMREGDQPALDAHGQRRFHGAFTGGFSAGFGNSVATPEGWSPATFRSTRSERATHSSQRPEQFMDEEDRSQFGIAPRQIQTQSDFSGKKRGRQERKFFDGPIPGEPVLNQLLRAVHETAAVRMLKAMGWRPGQGVGERRLEPSKEMLDEGPKVFGCYVPAEFRQDADENKSDSDTEVEYETIIAQQDYEPLVIKPKDDKFGLGYSGLSRHSVLGNLSGEYGSGSSVSHLVMKDKGKKVSIRGQAFGVGALEAEDEDIYSREDMSHYDFTMGPPEEAARQPKPSKKSSNVLSGFVPAKKPELPVPSFPPPALPRDYKPAPAGTRRSRFEPDTTDAARDQGLGRHELSSDARGKLLGEVPVARMEPEANNNAEKPIVATSQMDLIAKLVGRNVNFISTNETPEVPIEGNVFKPFESNPEKQARYERFMQNVEVDPETGSGDRLKEWERNREMAEFEQAAKLYKPLTGVMGDRFTHGSQPDSGVLNPFSAVERSGDARGAATEQQRAAAEKGMFGALTRTQFEWRPDTLVCKRFNIPDPFCTRPNPKNAEKPKTSYSIFDYLETSVHNKESFMKEQSQFSGSKSLLSTAPKPPETKLDPPTDAPKPHLTITEAVKAGTILNSSSNRRMTVADLFLLEAEKEQVGRTGDIEEPVEVVETIKKFDKMELYKSIFLSDSESDSETPVEKPNEAIDFIEKPRNIERNLSPPRGIFANIDFDELNSWSKSNVNKKQDAVAQSETASETGQEAILNADPTSKTIISEETSSIAKVSKEVDLEEESDIEENVYGPKIPENLKQKIKNSYNDVGAANLSIPKSCMDKDIASIVPKIQKLPPLESFRPVFRTMAERKVADVQVVDSSSSSDSWVDAESVKAKKHKKKKSKKQKKHKHKSKSKKKDR